MYVRVSNKSYRDIPFVDPSFTCCPSYLYSSVANLCKLEVPGSSLEELVSCRSIGLLHSSDGKFYICDINSTGGISSEIKIQISMLYLKSPLSTAMIESLVMPCPVQIFGSIRWHSRIPVIYVKIMQVLSVPQAIQIKDTMDRLRVFKSSYT